MAYQEAIPSQADDEDTAEDVYVPNDLEWMGVPIPQHPVSEDAFLYRNGVPYDDLEMRIVKKWKDDTTCDFL